jgi:Sec-independent protein translocase protein TatA
MTAYKILRWPILVVLCVILVLFFKRPERLSPNPQSPVAIAKNANAFQDKLGELQEAHQRGDGGVEVHLTSEEVGAALVVANPQPSAQVTPGATVVTPASTNSGSSATDRSEQVGVKDPQVIFDGDEVKGQFGANVYGKDVFVTLSGHLGAKDGYATFQPTSFKIGSMPVPISMVQAQLDKKMNEPETRERLKLPEFVSDLRIENGQLVITEK